MSRILIVDDDQSNSKIYATKLKAEGHEVVLCCNGELALEQIKEKFDVILLDIMMPKVGGVEVLEEIKKGINKKTVVIIYTNLLSEEVKKECLEKGAAEFLLKADYTPLQLLEKVKGYLT